MEFLSVCLVVSKDAFRRSRWALTGLDNQDRAFHQAGVLILAGTDANQAAGSPAQIQHGKALHDEVALLVEAG